MRETHKLLKDAQLSKAETEVRELLAKLEHLRTLLLAEDLDFQIKLARLRQMRETLGQLERIIKEERRELALVAVRHRATEALDAARRPPARPRGAGPRPEGRDRRHQRRAAKDERSAERRAERRSGEREAEHPQGGGRLAADPLFADLSLLTCSRPTPTWATR